MVVEGPGIGLAGRPDEFKKPERDKGADEESGDLSDADLAMIAKMRAEQAGRGTEKSETIEQQENRFKKMIEEHVGIDRESEEYAYHRMVDQHLNRASKAEDLSEEGIVKESVLVNWLVLSTINVIKDEFKGPEGDVEIAKQLRSYYKLAIVDDSPKPDFEKWIKGLDSKLDFLKDSGFRQEDLDRMVVEVNKPAEEWDVGRPEEGDLFLAINSTKPEFFSQWEEFSKPENRIQLRRQYPGWEAEDADLVNKIIKEKYDLPEEELPLAAK